MISDSDKAVIAMNSDFICPYKPSYNCDYYDPYSYSCKLLPSDRKKFCPQDLISRSEAISLMRQMQEDDIRTYGCAIPEGFDGDRAVIALLTLPTINERLSQ